MLGNNPQIEEIFSEAWQQVLAGRSIASVIAQHPEHASELEPMLQLMLSVRNLPTPALSATALASVHRRAKAALEGQSGPEGARRGTDGKRPLPTIVTPGKQGWFPQSFSAGRRSLSVLLPLILLGVLALIGITMLSDRQSDVRLESYSGVITNISSTEWTTDDTTIVINNATKIHGQPVVGARMVCLIDAASPVDRVNAIEIWVGVEPAPPLTVPTRAHDEGFLPGGPIISASTP